MPADPKLPAAVADAFSEKSKGNNGQATRRIGMGEVHRLLKAAEAEPATTFSLQAAGRLMSKVFPPWVQDLALLVESVEATRPPGALPDWQPGAVVRLPFSAKICGQGNFICSQAVMALADTAMVIACSAAANGYRPMSTIDQTTHFLRPVSFDIVADARVVRIGLNNCFGRVMLLCAADKRPVGMVATAYSML
jgi:acyl-coenzyme A thioesterase PaaI-like protein